MDPFSIGGAILGGAAIQGLTGYLGAQQQSSAINAATGVQQRYYDQLLRMQAQLMQQSAPFRAYYERLMPTLYSSAMNPQQSAGGRAASQTLGQQLAARGLTGSPAEMSARASLASNIAGQGLASQQGLASMLGQMGMGYQQMGLGLYPQMGGAMGDISQNIMAGGANQASFLAGLGSVIGQMPMQYAYASSIGGPSTTMPSPAFMQPPSWNIG